MSNLEIQNLLNQTVVSFKHTDSAAIRLSFLSFNMVYRALEAICNISFFRKKKKFKKNKK